LDLFAEESWRSVYAGELEVRPPGAPTTRAGARLGRRCTVGNDPGRSVLTSRLSSPPGRPTRVMGSNRCHSKDCGQRLCGTPRPRRKDTSVLLRAQVFHWVQP